MSVGLLATWLLPLLLGLASAAAEQCVFPAEWSGSWIDLQNGATYRVTFNRDTLSSKGRCFLSRPDSGRYALVKEASRDDIGPSACYYCIVFTKRTNNVLQYKEANEDQMYCVDAGAAQAENLQLDRICNNYLVNERLNTLIREAAAPVACPFHGSYLFTFNFIYGGCDIFTPPATSLPPDQQSRLISCASESQQLWTFIKRPCHSENVPAVDTKKVQCLGYWRDGEDWLYVKYDAEYRCIIYAKSNNVLTLRVSEDNTCAGVYSEMGAPLTLRLSSTPTVTARTSCNFPQWMEEQSWSDLSGQMLYVASSSKLRLRLQQTQLSLRRQSSHAYLPPTARHNETQVQYTCQSDLANSYYTRVFQECQTGCQCLTIRRFSTGVALMVRGPLETCSDHASCPSQSDISGSSGGAVRQLLFDSDDGRRAASCPFAGAYKLLRDDGHREVVYKVGCPPEAPTAMTVTTSRRCAGEDERAGSGCFSEDRSLSCLASWAEDSYNNFVVIGKKSAVNDTVSGLCYAYRTDAASGAVRLTADVTCSVSLYPMIIDRQLPRAIDMHPLIRKGSCDASDELLDEMSSAPSRRTAASCAAAHLPRGAALLAAAVAGGPLLLLLLLRHTSPSDVLPCC